MTNQVIKKEGELYNAKEVSIMLDCTPELVYRYSTVGIKYKQEKCVLRASQENKGLMKKRRLYKLEDVVRFLETVRLIKKIRGDKKHRLNPYKKDLEKADKI